MNSGHWFSYHPFLVGSACSDVPVHSLNNAELKAAHTAIGSS